MYSSTVRRGGGSIAAAVFLTAALLGSLLTAGCNRGGEESAASGTPGPSTLAPEAQAQMRAAQQADAARRSAPAPR